ncbi:hypothetical protein ACWDA7_47845 [Streptomyces sp. NPDC001156]
MRIGRAALGGAAIATVGILLTSSPAFAETLTVYQGADYGTYNTSTRNFTVCDKEADGHPVYSYFTLVGGGETKHVYDPDSYGGACGSGGPMSTSYRLNTYVVCEEIDFWPDNCNATGVY